MPQWQASGQGIKLLLNIHGSYIYAVDEPGHSRAKTFYQSSTEADGSEMTLPALGSSAPQHMLARLLAGLLLRPVVLPLRTQRSPRRHSHVRLLVNLMTHM